MAYTPTRLAATALTTTANTTIYTVPAGKTCIVKQVVFGGNSVAVTVSLAVNSVWLMNAVPLAANSVQTLDLSLVLAAGDVLQAWGSSTSVNVESSGVVFP